MATHKSAKKRARQAIKRRERNRQYMAKVRTAIKKLKLAVAANEGAETLKNLMVTAQSSLSKAAKKGIIHSNNAKRHISRLALSINKSGKSAATPVKAATVKKVAKKAAPVTAKKVSATAKKTSAIPAKKKSATKKK